MLAHERRMKRGIQDMVRSGCQSKSNRSAARDARCDRRSRRIDGRPRPKSERRVGLARLTRLREARAGSPNGPADGERRLIKILHAAWPRRFALCPSWYRRPVPVGRPEDGSGGTGPRPRRFPSIRPDLRPFPQFPGANQTFNRESEMRASRRAPYGVRC